MKRYSLENILPIASAVYLVKRKRKTPQGNAEAQETRISIEISEALSSIKDVKDWCVVSIERLPVDVVVHDEQGASLFVFAAAWANQASVFTDEGLL